MIDTPTPISLLVRSARLLNIVVFIAVLTLGGIYSLMTQKEAVSAEENRTLVRFPVYSDSSFWSGDYFRAIELYYADHFPQRQRWIEASTRFRSTLGFQSSELKLYSENQGGNNESVPDTIPKPDNQYRPEDGVTGELKKGVFVYKNRAFERFGGGPEMGRLYSSTVNGFTKLGLPSLQVYNLVIPLALEFEITEKYSKLQKSNRSAITNIYNALGSSVKKVWAIDELRKHRDEYIYFNTDHHWTSLGAYYAYRAFCTVANFTPVSLDTIPSRIKSGFLGSLYRLTRDPNLKNNPDSVRYYIFNEPIRFFISSSPALGNWIPSKMYAEGARDGNSYSVFIQGDLPIVKMETLKNNGRRIAIIKESYGNAFAPFLTNHYEKVVVVDQRYYTGDFVDMLQKEKINELLVINNIFAAHTPYHINKIKRLQQLAKQDTIKRSN